MGIKLSHSGLNLYEQCPRAYQLKYIDGYRETTTSSALTFGSACGTTFAMMLLDKKDSLTDEEKNIVGTNPFDYFDGLFSETQINGELVNLVNSPRCFYFKGDWDSEILTPEDWDIINSYREENGFLPDHTFDRLYSELTSGLANEAEKSFLSLHFWLSLRRKGHYMIVEFLKTIYPKVKKVYEIEGAISIPNGAGDEITGFLDLVADYEVEPDLVKKVIIDFKTASAKYSLDKLTESQQLNLYDYDRELGGVGYIVAIKSIKKPKVGPRKGEIYAEFQEMFMPTEPAKQEEIIQKVDEVLGLIKEEVFPKCEERCLKMFGRRCWAYDICHNNDDSKLFKKEKGIE